MLIKGRKRKKQLAISYLPSLFQIPFLWNLLDYQQMNLLDNDRPYGASEYLDLNDARNHNHQHDSFHSSYHIQLV
jgi:hypothetical protein